MSRAKGQSRFGCLRVSPTGAPRTRCAQSNTFATPRVVEDLAEGEPIGFEVVMVTSGGGIMHTRELAIGPEWAYVEEFGRDGDLVDEVAMD